MGAAYVQRDELLWHPRAPVGIPDLSTVGWERVRLKGADLAFRQPGDGAIAVRVRCREQLRPLFWESRVLWLGVPRDGGEYQERTVKGHAAIETLARSEGLQLRTLVIRIDEGCLLDIAQVGSGEELRAAFDAFVEGVVLGDGA